MSGTAALRTHGLNIEAGGRALVTGLELAFPAGSFNAVLGRNGSGKTLTLLTLAGLRPPGAGQIELAGRLLSTLSRRTVARQLGLLAQDIDPGFATTALESVLVARYPHLPLLARESAADLAIAADALRHVGLDGLEHRMTDTLSGGERRRCAVAALLAQQPRMYLLDEPTNHLDPHHQLAVLELFQNLCRQGHTVIATLHDPTLAARFADQALLLHGDGRWQAGAADQLLTSEALGELYHTPMVQLESHNHRVFANA